MKTIHTLEEVTSLDLTIFAINSHIKAYSLCWHINKILGVNLKKNKGAFVSEKEVFSCFELTLEEQKIILVKNKSKKGNLIPGKKKIDYFLIFEPMIYKDRKTEFLSKLSESSKILLIFELDLEKEPEAHRFIFND